MKQLSQLAAAAVVVLGAMTSTGAVAGPTCGLSCQYQGSNTYVGSVNVGSFGADNFNYARRILPPPGGSLPVGTSLSDFWVFDLAPIGGAFQVNMNFQAAITGLTNARIQLWSGLSEGPGQSCGPLAGLGLALGQQCSYVTDPRSSLIALADSWINPAGPDGSQTIFPLALTPGRYVFTIEGITTATSSSYSGQVFVNPVPAPATIGLVGLALLGASLAGTRRSRKA